jgi:hypothetical protein
MRWMESLAAGVAVALVMGCTPSDESTPVEPVSEDAIADSTSDTSTIDSTLPDTTTEDTESLATLGVDSTSPDTTTDVLVDSAKDTATTDSTTDTAVADTVMADTAMADTAMADTAFDVVTDGALSCGSAPYQLYDPVSAYMPTGMPTTDVTISTNICAGGAVVVPYMKTRTMNVQQKTPFFWIATQTGSAPLLSPEGNISIAVFAKLGFSAVMLPTSYMTIKNPAWDPTKHAVIEVMVNASTGTGACAAKDGVVYTVVGHPEAVINYGAGATATRPGGDAGAWITIVTTGTLAAPEYITLTQTKPGCTVGLTASDKVFLTGRAPVAIGYRTATMTGEVTN